jgi:hypothetical protein
VTAIWHFSEDASIQRFEPCANSENDSAEPLVWGIDDEHAPAYRFPRECPRGTFWSTAATSDDDVENFLAGDRSRRVHAIQSERLDAVRAVGVFAYRLPSDTFEPHPQAAGYWVSRAAVVPIEVAERGDLLPRHAEAGIELRVVPRLRPPWHQVIASSLEFSGILLRNLEERERNGSVVG